MDSLTRFSAYPRNLATTAADPLRHAPIAPGSDSVHLPAWGLKPSPALIGQQRVQQGGADPRLRRRCTHPERVLHFRLKHNAQL